MQMKSEKTDCALETGLTYWNSINWKKAESSVRSLQLRIAKAYCRVVYSTLRLLEPYDGKLSRTVLRGQRRSNPPELPDTVILLMRINIIHS